MSEPAEALANESSVEVLASMTRHLEELLDNFTEDERDPMLPVNHERQQMETAQVTSRLGQLREELETLREAAERAHEEYMLATKRVFRAYFGRLKVAAEEIDFFVDGRLEQLENGRFRCDVKVGIGDKTPVHHDSQQLSGGQKAALSILILLMWGTLFPPPKPTQAPAEQITGEAQQADAAGTGPDAAGEPYRTDEAAPPDAAAAEVEYAEAIAATSALPTPWRR